MTFVTVELASQPRCWALAGSVDVGGLPSPGERVAAVGCGTSRFMAQSYAARREAAGLGETDAFAASELPARAYDCVVALSRSGTTTEVVELLDRLEEGSRSVALTAVAGSPVADRADATVLLDFAAEQSVVQTRFATTALAVLRASLGEDLGPAGSDAATALELAHPASPGAHRQLTFLGRGWSEGLAQEAALKCRESAGMWAEAYTAMEYRHGPISAAGPHTLVWALGPLPPGLADEIEAMGATVEVGRLDPMAELVRIQRFAVALAEKAGLDPDHPRGLRYSVVLDG
jgi:fructoselysine-6-P-deglycase FrlB-like protein